MEKISLIQIKKQDDYGVTERIERIGNTTKVNIAKKYINGTSKHIFTSEKIYEGSPEDGERIYNRVEDLTEKMLKGTRYVEVNDKITTSKINYRTEDIVIRDEEFDDETSTEELNLNEQYIVNISRVKDKINKINLKIDDEINIDLCLDFNCVNPKTVINIGGDEYELRPVKMQKEIKDEDNNVVIKKEYQNSCYKRLIIDNTMKEMKHVEIKTLETREEDGKTITIKEITDTINNNTGRIKVERYIDDEGYECTRTIHL